MKKILVPLDGSKFAESAIAPAARLATRHSAGVVLASVVSDLPPVPLASTDGEMVTRWFEAEEGRVGEYLAGVKKHLEASHPGVRVESRVELGPVARTLMAQAGEVGADLIAMTTHGRGAWQRAWLGSVADGILRGSQRPILLLREGDASEDLFAQDDSPAHVVVPMDGSSEAEAILGPLTSLLPSSGGRVTLLSVVREPFPLASSYLPHAVEEERVAEEQKERIEKHFTEVAERWSPVGVEVASQVLVSDDVARSVLKFVDEANADLLALSTRGRGGVGRLVLGSVADKLIRATDLPVLAVRRPGESE
jgi:nucleotide-binding universal stress UspA family protein